jgi:hypothetical protein
MAKEAMALNGSMENRTVEGMIRRKFWKQCEASLFFFLILFLEDDKWSLLKFVVVVFDFHYASDYIMASNMFLLVLYFIKGWC